LNFSIAYKNSRYLRLASIFVAFAAAVGMGTSAFFIFESLIAAIASAAVCFWLFIRPLNLQKTFDQPELIDWRENKKAVAVFLDNKVLHPDRLWANSLFVVITGTISETFQGFEKPRYVRVMLGKDVISDNSWHSLQTWRVWRQRGV
jgi:hypothetical protein